MKKLHRFSPTSEKLKTYVIVECQAMRLNLAQEARVLQSNAREFGRQTAQWLKLLSGFNTALKVTTCPLLVLSDQGPGFVQEIGDVESWAKTIEWEMKTVATAIEFIQQGKQ